MFQNECANLKKKSDNHFRGDAIGHDGHGHATKSKETK
jgi:hypothetical protein